MKLGGVDIAPGSRQQIWLPLTPLYNNATMEMPVEVIRGRRPGPHLFVSAAVHGDEINGVEIIRRLLKSRLLKGLKGALIAVPVVNVYGFIAKSRYLPDRRDLNRFFPGSAKGSMAARLANTFMEEVVANASHGIDLHTGALHRTNLPQIRTNLNDPQALAMARAFRVPVVLNSELRDGSLRAAALDAGLPVLLYEAGEALRFDEHAIRAGLRGIINVMRHIGMLPAKAPPKKALTPLLSQESRWVRAPVSGMLTQNAELGQAVKKGQVIAEISSPLDPNPVPVKSPVDGIVIGAVTMPLLHEGEALFNVAHTERADRLSEQLPHFYDNLERLSDADFPL
ncbi:succinylglutamate desuccinylase/aspartoacylase family protein [Gallaecimonas sp. GXIMD4217]|uniref:succinylglutamate desuccinylase/aspartoacylase family protein n=1 Tax=Gallaecimonas sp. GXIMD4217 TaxID=3131927 RepID=UPI00311B10C8